MLDLNWSPTGYRLNHALHGSFTVHCDFGSSGVPVLHTPTGSDEPVWLGSSNPRAAHYYASEDDAKSAVVKRIAELDAALSEQCEACRAPEAMATCR